MIRNQSTAVERGIPVLLLTGVLLFLAYSPLLRAFFDPQDFLTIMVPRSAGWSLERYLAEGWIYTESDGTVGGFFRPLSSLLYIPEYELFGTNPVPWMAVSVIIHFTCCAAVGWLALRLGMSRASAALATLLMAAHPRAVIAVQMVNTRPDVLATLFIVLALGFFVKSGDGSRWKPVIPALLAFAAMSSKELGFVSALLLPIAYFVWPRETRGRLSPLPVLLTGAALLLMFLLRTMVLDYLGGYRVYNPPGEMTANTVRLFGNLTGVSWVVPEAARVVSGLVVAAFLSVPMLVKPEGWRRLAVLTAGTALLGAQALINFGPGHYEYGACAFFCLLVAASAGEILRGRRIGEWILLGFYAVALVPPALLGRRMNEGYAASTGVQRKLFEAAGRSWQGIDPSVPWQIELDSERTEKLLPYYVAYYWHSEDHSFSFVPPGSPGEPGTGIIRYDGTELLLTPPEGMGEP